MQLYSQTTQDLINNNLITADRIYNYEDSPYFDLYDSAFNFYTETLKQNSHFGIEPSYLFYENDNRVNAFAQIISGSFVIGIYMGTVYYLIERFHNRPDILVDTDSDSYLILEQVFDCPINELMFQNAFHFTFYHEMAHLIQKSEFLNTKLNEQPDIDDDFNIKKHLLELDADQFSSLSLASHLMQYACKSYGDKITIEIIEKLIAIICSSSLFYILSFQSIKLGIYYEVNSHPHPLIRITCIILHITKYCKENFAKIYPHLSINVMQVIKECLRFSNNIAVKKFNSNQIEDYLAILEVERYRIIQYIAKIRALEEKDNSLASLKWNKFVSP